MKKILVLAAMVAVCAILGQSHSVEGGIVVAWDTTGLSGVTAGSLNATSSDANISSAVLSRGAGVTASSLTNGYASNNWAASRATAESGSKYYQVAFTVDSGYQASLTDLNLNFRNTSTGVRSLQWVYSFDSFSTQADLGTVFSLPGATTVADYNIANLGSISAFQNFTGSVTFRLLGWNDTGNLATNGTGAIGTATGNNLALLGTVSAVPEPSALLLVGSIIGFGAMRRRRS